MAWPELRQAWGSVRRIALDAVVLAAVPRPAPTSDVCIVRVDGIGDFVLWIDACRQLVAQHRAAGARVVLVANAIWAQWARELELADEVWEFDRARFANDAAYRAQWLRRMRAAGFDTVLQPAHSRRPAEGDALVRASGAPKRIGSAGDSTNSPAWLLRWADGWYTERIACGSPARMELLRNAEFMRGLGFTGFRARAPSLGAKLPANPVAFAHKSYAVLFPGAAYELRAWPRGAFAEVGRRLAAKGVGLVLVGGAGDRAVADALLRELPSGVEDFTGRTTLGELAAIMAGAKLVIANETGAAHIAAAAGTQVVCVMGGGHYGRFMPYQLEDGGERRIVPIAVAHKMDCFGCNWRCIYARAPGEPVKCIKDLSLEEVWPQVEACLEPENPGAHFLRGVELQAEGRFDEANGCFKEALRLHMGAEAVPDAPVRPGPRVPVAGTTLVCVDCRNHELAIAALRRSMAQCGFERVLFFTDRAFDLPGIETVVIPDIASIADYSRFMLKSLGDWIETPHLLVVQYDGFVLNGSRWDNAFRDYDYLGAPWPDGGVGNGGFSLRSKKLQQALRDPRITELVPEDVAICKTYRKLLEQDYGIRFAPADLAARFSFETVPPPGPTLGFHGLTHLVRVVEMSEEELANYKPAPMIIR